MNSDCTHLLGVLLLLQTSILIEFTDVVHGQNVTTTTTTTTTSTSASETTTQDIYSEFVGPIRKCPKGSDEMLNHCMKLILQDLKPRLAVGVPEIALPPLDPLHINQSNFEQGFGAIVIKAVFTNLSVSGLSNFTDATFTVNSKHKELHFSMKVPRVLIEGTYTLGGNILFFSIGGTGPYWFDVGDLDVFGTCFLKTAPSPNQSDGKRIAVVDHIKIDIDIKRVKVALLNLFNGNMVLGPIVNNVLNENGEELFQDIKPNVAKEVGEIMTTIVNAVISNLDFIADILE